MPTQTEVLSRLSKTHPNKRAFITGAGSGLGLMFAKTLACHRWKIGINDIDASRLESAAQEVRLAGGEPTTDQCDVTDFNAFTQAIHAFDQKHGGIDIGINNAGIGCGGLIHEVPIEIFRRVIDINVMGVVNGCHLFVPIMKRQQTGHILNVASAAAFVAAPRMTAYSTSKAAVLALSETLRAELNEDKILVTVLMPTYVRTNIGIDSLGNSEDTRRAQMLVAESSLQAEEVVAHTLKEMSAGALYVGTP